MCKDGIARNSLGTSSWECDVCNGTGEFMSKFPNKEDTKHVITVVRTLTETKSFIADHKSLFQSLRRALRKAIAGEPGIEREWKNEGFDFALGTIYKRKKIDCIPPQEKFIHEGEEYTKMELVYNSRKPDEDLIAGINSTGQCVLFRKGEIVLLDVTDDTGGTTLAAVQAMSEMDEVSPELF